MLKKQMLKRLAALMIEKIYLLSFPRSGNTFVRYLLEQITEYRSEGYPESGKFDEAVSTDIDFRPSGIIIKRHGHQNKAKNELDLNSCPTDKLLFLIRNPVEAFIRHAQHGNAGLRPVQEFIRGDIQSFKYFFDNLALYHTFPGKKSYIFYEDLVENPSGFVKELIKFVDDPVVSVEDVMKNYKMHFEKGRQKYGSRSATDGRTTVAHSSVLSTPQRDDFWKMFIKNTPPHSQAIFNRYIT